jgi:hypothetical protein
VYSCGVWKSIALSPGARFWLGLEEQGGCVVVVVEVLDVVVVEEVVVLDVVVVDLVVVVDVVVVVVVELVVVVPAGSAVTVITTFSVASPKKTDPWIIIH